MDISKIQSILPATADSLWQYGTFIGIVALMLVYFSVAGWYKQTYGQFTSSPYSIAQLLTIRRSDLSSAIDPLVSNNNSVCRKIMDKNGIYSRINTKNSALVNWRPLTVRLTGYLGGNISARDGVFDMDKGVQLALSQGARAFVLDIDYLEDAPCEPVLVYRDPQGYMRSLHTGSVKDGCTSLANRAFQTNYDPVIVIVYIHRLPPGINQKSSFFKGIAASLKPLSTYHLGSSDQGDYHNCKLEDQLFTSPITNFQKNFIVLTNYNTTTLPATPNPSDNLDFWTNARIYQDPSGLSSSLGSVTGPVPTGQIAYATAGESQQLLKIPSANQANYTQTSANTFKIALGDIAYSYSVNDLSMLMNTLGIQCVPIDVVGLSASKQHLNTIKTLGTRQPSDLMSLSNPTNPADPLSFWAYSGWSRKNIIEGFDNPPPVISTPILGYVIPTPTVPKKPSASMNSNGGLVNIA